MAEPTTILLVDDDIDFLAINRLVLEAEGYAVRCVSDPQRVLDEMADRKPDLVITDLMMDSLDAGFALCAQIKDDPRFQDVLLIIVTGMAGQLGLDFQPSGPEDLAAMRADAYLSKPVTPEALRGKVRALLAERAQNDTA